MSAFRSKERTQYLKYISKRYQAIYVLCVCQNIHQEWTVWLRPKENNI